MNKGHKLVKRNKKDSKGKTTHSINKTALVNLGLTLILGVIFCMSMHIPFTYSTFAHKRIVNQLTSAITSEYDGIVASTNEVEVEGYNYNVKSSQDFIIEHGDEQLDYLARFEELGMLKSGVDVDDLWAVYYTYFSEDYAANINLYQQIVAWYSVLEDEDNGDYINTCAGEDCRFVDEINSIIALDKQAIIDSNAHATYHKQVAESEQVMELTDEDMQQLYETYLLTHPEFVDSIAFDFTLVNQLLLTEKPDLANWALNYDKFPVEFLLGNIKYSAQFSGEQVAEIFRYMNTALDDEIITDEIVAYVPKSLLAYGVDADGLSTGITTIVNITGVENVEEWLKNNKSITHYKDITTEEQFIDLGFAKLFWDIKSIDYADNIPTYEELTARPEWVQKIRTDLVEQAVWQKFYTGE